MLADLLHKYISWMPTTFILAKCNINTFKEETVVNKPQILVIMMILNEALEYMVINSTDN